MRSAAIARYRAASRDGGVALVEIQELVAQDRPERLELERGEKGLDVGLGGHPSRAGARRTQGRLPRVGPAAGQERAGRDDLQQQGQDAAAHVDLASGDGDPAAGHPVQVEPVLLQPVLRLAHVAPDRGARDTQALLECLRPEWVW